MAQVYVTPDTWEAEMGNSRVQCQPGKLSRLPQNHKKEVNKEINGEKVLGFISLRGTW